MAETTSRVRLVFEGSEHGVVAAASKSIAAIKALGNENTKVGKTFAVADQGATKFIQTTTRVAAATSVVAAAGGLIGQTFAGALPALTALGVAGATIALGMDGIGKAAGQLKKPFDDLKKSIADNFARQLTPVFADLKGVITGIRTPLLAMSTAISRVADDLVGVVASASGIKRLQIALAGAASFIEGMGNGLARFLDGILTFASNIQGSMEGLGTAFGSIFGQIGDALRNLPIDVATKAVDGFSATLTGLGKVFATVIDVAIRLGAAFGDSFGVLLNGLADGISKASPGLVDLGSALGDLFRAIAPLLPTIGELAGSFAHSLADGIRAVIPYVQQFADWARNNVGTVKGIAEGILALALAVKALKIFTSVVGWVDGVVGVLGRFRGSAAEAGTAAEVAGGKIQGFGGKMSALKGAGGAAGVALAIGAIGVAIDELNIKAAGGVKNLDGIAVNLHQFRDTIGKIFSGDIGFGQMIDQAKAAALGVKNALSGFKLTPLKLDLDTAGAAAQKDKLIAEINGAAPTVNINGNTNGAAFAYQEILREIADGKAEIIIDGQPVPAQEALARVKSLIDTSVGTTTIDGNPAAASTALGRLLGNVNSSVGTIVIEGNKDPATGKVQQAVSFADGSKGTITVDGNPVPANGKTTGAVTFANGSRGTITIDGNQTPANGKINATVTYADGRVGTIQINANTGSAQGVIDGFISRNDGRQIRIFTSVLGAGGIASAGRLAAGGPVHGPGSGTSDTAGLFALSNGEHVLTAREVAAAGGHAAIMRFRRSLAGGSVPRMAATRGRAATGGGVTANGALSIPAPQVNVQVHVDGNEVRSIVRTEISQASRSTRRTVLAGAGNSF